jgi:hypothetical protein
MRPPVRVAATLCALGALGCTAPEPASDSAAGPRAASGSEAPASGSLGSWQPLFRLQYDDPGMIERFLADARATPGARRTILAETTLSWGCACPTWVFPFYQDMRELQHLMVLPAPALEQDPTDFATPERTYRLTGYFSGETQSGLDWAKQRRARPPNFPKGGPDDPEAQEYWSAAGLAFVVESWCFEENAQQEENRWLRERGASPCPR